MTESDEHGRGRAGRMRRVALTQLAAYALLAASGVALVDREWSFEWIVWVGVVAGLLVAGLLVGWPLPLSPGDGLVDRILCALAGAGSYGAVLVGLQLSGSAGSDVPDPSGTDVLERWGALTVLLAAALLIVGFIRQLLRAERSHMIRSLSNMLVGGIASIACVGWAFLPVALRGAFHTATPHAGTVRFHLLAVLVAVALIAALSVVSFIWIRDENRPAASTPEWLGVALLPVMFSGFVIFLCALAVELPPV